MLTIDQEKFPIEGNYIIGVSGGPDSMCLLFTLFSYGYHIIACNVNYNTRDVSSKEQEMVMDFCKKNNIECETLSVKHSSLDKNFEGWARDARYTFFRDMYKKHNANGLFIAHHKNDDLETYILQKNRNNIVKRWGLAQKTTILGMKVLRPFLGYTKKELLQECEKNNIPYSIDVTNLQPICERNKVRLSLMDKYSLEDIEKIFKQKDEDNKKLEEQMNKIKPLLEKTEWLVQEIKPLSEIEKIRFIYEIVVKKIPKLSSRMSRKRIEDYLKLLFAGKPNINIDIDDGYSLCQSYGKFKLISNKGEENFVFILEKPGALDTKYFSCNIPTDAAFLKIDDSSYPLTIRTAKMDDVVTFGNVRKKVNRIMIDEKIPLYRRNCYPVIVDKNQKVVYFPLYNSDIQKNIASKLCFVLK